MMKRRAEPTTGGLSCQPSSQDDRAGPSVADAPYIRFLEEQLMQIRHNLLEADGYALHPGVTGVADIVGYDVSADPGSELADEPPIGESPVHSTLGSDRMRELELAVYSPKVT